MDNKFTKLTLEQSDLKITWEMPYEDLNGNDMCKAFRTILIGMTFGPDTIENIFADYLNEYSDKYEVNYTIKEPNNIE